MEKKDLYLKDEQIEQAVLDKCNAGIDVEDEDRVIVEASADFAVKKVAELIEELEEDPAKYYDQLGKVVTLGDLKYGLLKLLEGK